MRNTRARLFRYLLPFISLITSQFLFRFLGSENRMIKLVLLGIVILGLIFLFHYFHRRYGSRLLCIMLLFFTSLFCYSIRIYVVSDIGFLFSDVLTVFMGTCAVLGSGGEVTPHSENIKASSSEATSLGQVPNRNDAGPSNPGLDIALHGRALPFAVSFALRKVGLRGGLALAIGGALQALIYSYDDIGMSVLPTGSDSTSSGTSSSNPGNPVVPPIDQGVHGEVQQDTIWDAVDAEERRKEAELRNSKEWKESERHLLKVENVKKAIGQRAKEIAQERGLTPGRCEAVEDAAKYIAEDVEEVPEKQQVHFLVKLMRDLNNPNSEPWERIEEEVKRWRSWED